MTDKIRVRQRDRPSPVDPDQKELVMSHEMRVMTGALPRHPHHNQIKKSALQTEATVPVAEEDPTAGEVLPVTNDVDAASVDNSRRHVQQSLHQLDRLVRHAIKDEIKEAGDMDHETVTALRELTKTFKADLQTIFHEAGRGNDFDRSTILSGIGDAVVSLTERLSTLRGADEIPVEPPEVVPVPDEPSKPDLDEFVEPGGLLESYA